jgi:tetratricopeptide (TPR) repeat protein
MSGDTPAESRSIAREAAVLLSLLVVHGVLAVAATWNSGVTFDEPLHIVAGLTYWQRGDYRLQPENGNLPQRWCALPLVFLLPRPPLDEAAWRRSDAPELGRELLYDSPLEPETVLRAARALPVCWSISICGLVYAWSRRLNGPGGAAVALVLATFWPALLAHGPLATSDACLTCLFTASCLALWTSFARVSVATLAASSAAVGLAAIAKHSAILLAPVALALLAAAAAVGLPLTVHFGRFHWSPATAWQRAGSRLAILFPPLLAAVACIWAAHGFRYQACASGEPTGEFYFFESLAGSAERAGVVGQAALVAARWRLLPEAWLHGLCTVVAKGSARNAFAVGQYSTHGWWWYFPLCLGVKNTIPGVLLVLWGSGAAMVALAMRPRAPHSIARVAPLVVVLVLVPILFASRLNIGERHCLPLYPPLLVLAGAAWPARGTVCRLVIGGLLAWHAVEGITRWPATLAYFNQVVPRGREHEWLVDSNLDWGQDLPRLAAWLAEHRRIDEPVYVSLFSSARIEYHLPFVRVLGRPADATGPQRLEPGLYCVSATALRSVYDEPLGRWCRKFEATYQRSREYLEADPAAGDPDASAVRQAAVQAFNMLQAGRLRAFLRQRQPDADVGGSILVFRLTAADLAAALRGPPAELDEMSWMEREAGGSAADLVRRGEAALEAGDLLQAEQTLEQATRLEPADPRGWQALAKAYDRRGRPDKAISAFDRAIVIEPDDPVALLGRCRLLVRVGRDDEARSDRAALARLGVGVPRDLAEPLERPAPAAAEQTP